MLSPGRERFSLPFFYAPRVDAEIRPLPLADAEQFVPFLYGDHAWASLPKPRRLFGDRKSQYRPVASAPRSSRVLEPDDDPFAI